MIRQSLSNKLIYKQFRKVFASDAFIKFLDYAAPIENIDFSPPAFFSFLTPQAHGGMELGLAISALMCEEVAKSANDFGIVQRLSALEFLNLNHNKVDKDCLSLLDNVISGKSAAFAFCSASNTSNEIIESMYNTHAVQSNHNIIIFIKEQNSYAVYLINDNDVDIKKHTLFGLDVYQYVFNLSSLSSKKLLAKYAINDFNLHKAFACQLIYHTAYLLGIARKAHQLAIERISAREQFGKKIIEYQHPRFTLAKLLAEIEICQVYFDYAIWAIENNTPLLYEVSNNALKLMKKSAYETLQVSLHLHGAYGLTKQAEIQKLYQLFALHNGYINEGKS